MELAGVVDILGGEKVLHARIRNRMDLIDLSCRGVSKDALTHLARYLSFSVKQLADLLPVTERTVQRYASGKVFNRTVSEQILQIAEVAAKGTEVFEDRDRFLLWMNHPNRAFNDETPMSLLKSRFGAEMVMDELGRMEYGVFS